MIALSAVTMIYKIKVQYSSFSKNGSIQPLYSDADPHRGIDPREKSIGSITSPTQISMKIEVMFPDICRWTRVQLTPEEKKKATSY